MNIVLDRAKCEGLGMCEAMAPDIFEVGDDEIAVVRIAEPSDDQQDDVRMAVESCPVRALTLTD